MTGAFPNFPMMSFRSCLDQIKSAMPVAPFVLQIGAMDGVRFDLLYPVLSAGGWRGLLIEPMPDMFALLQQNYAAHPQFALVNCAVSDHEGTLALYRVDPALVESGQVRENMLGMTSAFPERAMLRDAELNKNLLGVAMDQVQRVDVPCRTLPALLQQNNVGYINVVVIDTEGADWLIASQLDLVKHRPTFVCLEFFHLPAQELNDCCAHFFRHGYKAAVCEEDNENLIFYMTACTA